MVNTETKPKQAKSNQISNKSIMNGMAMSMSARHNEREGKEENESTIAILIMVTNHIWP